MKTLALLFLALALLGAGCGGYGNGGNTDRNKPGTGGMTTTSGYSY